MIHEIETGAAQAKHAVSHAAESVTDAARDGGGRIERAARMALRVMPLLPERAFEFLLDRAGLARKTSGLGAVALFAGGFVAGSVTTAFTTPISGPAMRKKLLALFSSSTKEPEVAAAVETNKTESNDVKVDPGGAVEGVVVGIAKKAGPRSTDGARPSGADRQR